jgi:RNA polymerase sigma-70 factor, ECF subfamily
MTEAVYFPETIVPSSDAEQRDARASESAMGASGPWDAKAWEGSRISDEQLLEQVRSGAKEAIAHLFRRHARTVHRVALRILRDHAEAEDLVQEVFLFIFRKAALYDPARGAGASWIIHVTYHRAIDRRRFLNSRRFYSTQQFEEVYLEVADSNRDGLIEPQSMESVLGKNSMSRFQSRLTPEQQETIQLFFFEGYTLKEIAERTGRSIVNVRSHFYRGLERMRKYVLHEKSLSK